MDLELIINSTHDGVIAIDRSGRITLFNRAAEDLTGRSAVEVLGRQLTKVIPTTELPRILETGIAELNVQQPLGKTTIVTSRMPILDNKREIVGAFSVFRDVSGLIELAEEITHLNEMRIMWEAIFNSTQDAISVVDEKGLQVSVNPAYSAVTGLTREEVIGRPCTVDIAAGESIHMAVLKTHHPVKGARVRVGRTAKEVIVDAAPIIVKGKLRGSVAVIKDVSEIAKLNSELRHAHQIIRKLQAKYSFDDIVGTQPVFAQALVKAKLAAGNIATVLLRGESGTGKELFAHAIHNASDRRDEKFVRINCASLNESLLESELFGYEDGAFTGARKGGRTGLFEEADGGTLFLDEIGVMSPDTQARLLRVVQENEVRRVGGTRPITVNVRVIAATNLDIEAAVAAGRFREDLYYRINVLPIEIPALREHLQDLPLLVDHIIKKINTEYGRAISTISPAALRRLSEYPWPGNVRELENILRQATINLSFYETVIGETHLPELGFHGGPRRAVGNALPPPAQGEYLPRLKTILERAEAEHITAALELHKGRRGDTARALGISLRSLEYKLKQHGIRPRSCKELRQ